MMRALVGTSGFSYTGWRGGFYPAKLAASRMLSAYAQRLPTVEINNTFYKLPTAKLLASWAEQVPASFRFVFKASRFLSHRFCVRGAKAPLTQMLALLETVGPKCGALFVQVPPYFEKDLVALRDFLDLLPAKSRVVLECRHVSWQSEDVYEILRTRNVPLCITELEDIPLHVVKTADWGYFRLRKLRYEKAALTAWAKRLRKLDLREAYVFFKHEDEGIGPNLAVALQENLS